MLGWDWPCFSQQGTWVVVEEHGQAAGLCLRELVGTTVLSAASAHGCQQEPPLYKGSLACQSSGVSQMDSKAIVLFLSVSDLAEIRLVKDDVSLQSDISIPSPFSFTPGQVRSTHTNCSSTCAAAVILRGDAGTVTFSGRQKQSAQGHAMATPSSCS